MINQVIASTVLKDEPKVHISIVEKTLYEPKANQVIVEVRAAPVNPSDLALLLSGGADLGTCKPVSNGCAIDLLGLQWHKGLKARHGLKMPVGNEGAGVVVKTGSSEAARQLLGKPVYLMGGKMFCKYRTVDVNQVVVLDDYVPQVADLDSYFVNRSSFINPLTVLGFVHTMEKQGHTALVHTAAASQLGRILIRVCAKKNIPLVNIVRKDEQVKQLTEQEGAKYVVNSSSPDFKQSLVDALVATGATCAFDATGGGKLAGQILAAMETSINLRNKNEYSRYGSDVHKQCYLYGSLDMSPTVFNRGFGMNWSMGGWLLMPFLASLSPSDRSKVYAEVVAELKSESGMFATSFSNRVSLEQAVQPDHVKRYGSQATGTKYVITPFQNSPLAQPSSKL